MKVYDTEAIRNVAIVGHRGAGKTSLVSALLWAAGTTDELGSVVNGTAPTDFDPDEIERQQSLSLGAAAVEWRAHKLNLLDAPGASNFLGDATAALWGADATMIVVHAVDGIRVQTERMWDESERLGRPVMFVVSQLDRDLADFNETVAALQERFGQSVIPVSFPILEQGALRGVVRLLTGRAYTVEPGSRELVTGDAPADMTERVTAEQEKLFDVVTESDDELMEVFLEQGQLDAKQLVRGLRVAIAARTIFPVFAATGTGAAGAHALLDALVDIAPHPSDHSPIAAKADGDDEISLAADASGSLVAQTLKTYIDPFAGRISLIRIFSGRAVHDQPVWNSSSEHAEKLTGLMVPLGKEGQKVDEANAGDIVTVTKLKETHTGDALVADKAHALSLPTIPFPKPVIAYAVKATVSGTEEKVTAALQRLSEEDRTLKLERDARTHELMLSGLGISHVKMTLTKMEKKYGVAATLEKPKVPYLETITKTAKSSYKHKKQSGGAGQFAEVHLRVEPLPRGSGFQYESEVFGGSISRNYWPSIEKGIRQVMDEGAVAGHPLVDVKAVIFDGKEHPVDSKDIAFQIAGRHVFRQCVQAAGPVVLEPVMKVTVTCPDDSVGDILGDLNRRRGRVQGQSSQAGRANVDALVPMAEMLEYTATLRSLTSGAGSYEMDLDHYSRVPAEIQKALMAEFKPAESEA